MIVTQIVRKILARFKRIPIFYTKYSYKANIVAVVPHQGLGDLVVLVNALSYLCERHDTVYIVCPKRNFDQLKAVIILPVNLKLIRYRDVNMSWRLSSKYKAVIKRYAEKILRLGYFNNDPIYDYPNSFYASLGVPLDNVHQQLNFKRLSTPKPFKKYVYKNLLTSTINFEYSSIDPSFNVVEYLSPETLSFNNKVTYINPVDSLSINLELALMADRVCCSDAGFFNLLNYFEKLPKIRLFTRYTYYRHNSILYSCIFDGQVKDYIKK